MGRFSPVWASRARPGLWHDDRRPEILTRRANVPDAVRRIGPEAIRIEVGHLIDGTDTAPIDDAAILILDDRIAEVGPAASVASPENARRYSFPNATALPGLIDAHVHITFAGDVDPLGT